MAGDPVVHDLVSHHELLAVRNRLLVPKEVKGIIAIFSQEVLKAYIISLLVINPLFQLLVPIFLPSHRQPLHQLFESAVD